MEGCDFFTCSSCHCQFFYESDKCQMCARGYEQDLFQSLKTHKFLTKEESERFDVYIFRFKPCSAYPNGIVLQCEPTPAWNVPRSRRDECFCKQLGNPNMMYPGYAPEMPSCKGVQRAVSVFETGIYFSRT